MVTQSLIRDMLKNADETENIHEMQIRTHINGCDWPMSRSDYLRTILVLVGKPTDRQTYIYIYIERERETFTICENTV